MADCPSSRCADTTGWHRICFSLPSEASYSWIYSYSPDCCVNVSTEAGESRQWLSVPSSCGVLGCGKPHPNHLQLHLQGIWCRILSSEDMSWCAHTLPPYTHMHLHTQIHIMKNKMKGKIQWLVPLIPVSEGKVRWVYLSLEPSWSVQKIPGLQSENLSINKYLKKKRIWVLYDDEIQGFHEVYTIRKKCI